MLYEKELTDRIIAAAIEVHRQLGPGLLESTYEECFCRELQIRRISFERQKNLAPDYKGLPVDGAYRIDLIVEKKVVLELKCCEAIAKAHEAQLLTYLRLSKIKVGIILNFNEATMTKGIRRMIL